jgi:RNA polymerase sigma-70 factor (ECF subfamily)
MFKKEGTIYLNWVKELKGKNCHSAYKKIYEEFWDSLFAVAYNKLGSKEIVEEMLQEIFLDLWKRRATIKIKSSLPGYLHMALKYKIYTHISQLVHQRKYMNHELGNKNGFDYSTSELLAFEELYEQLQAGLDKLPEKCRLVFKMSREEQKNSVEIGKELGISHRTVQTHIHNALKLLKKDLSDFIMCFLV